MDPIYQVYISIDDATDTELHIRILTESKAILTVITAAEGKQIQISHALRDIEVSAAQMMGSISKLHDAASSKKPKTRFTQTTPTQFTSSSTSPVTWGKVLYNYQDKVKTKIPIKENNEQALVDEIERVKGRRKEITQHINQNSKEPRKLQKSLTRRNPSSAVTRPVYFR
ncbi:unnamed protein product [Mytilus edulis]|uniref:Uncharacterized protein n=1 Tax=Mytilus edulis TaxID=6550 RepID=A0A8S3RAT3_MYTED|nr:unnamed protein product [Mytilus edulis]